ncbi:hypothetical protein BDA99DRAFT_530571 [Phascolomyces articulosus]|uniref:Uncharacterized protein n=1 Tax=Phascolomyces articulosus TaxID=60185 RepID=A0AAD5JVV2_9FUNG|nr:hypothetical protein BDA99DRAFT_530571 [Phascolomyces articulosus]
MPKNIKPPKVPKNLTNCKFTFNTSGTKLYFLNQDLKKWSFDDYQQSLDEDIPMNDKRTAYIDDLTWISHQNVPREVKNYIKSLIAYAKQSKANNPTVRNNDTTYSIVVKGDNFGGIGNNSKTTIFKQSEKRSSEAESSQAVNKRQRHLEEREEEEEEKEENNDHDDDEFDLIYQERLELQRTGDDDNVESGVLIEHNSLDGHKRRVYIYDYLENVNKVWQPLKH